MGWPACVIFLALCGGAVARISYYMDLVLHSYLPQQAKTSNVDPVRLANFTTESEDKVAFVQVKVKMNYYNGEMSGLLKARRASDCSPIRQEKGNSTIKCTIIFKDIKFDYHAKMKYGQLPNTSVKAHGKFGPTFAVVEVTTSSTRNSPYMKHMKLSKLGNIQTTFTGLGPLNSQLKKLTEKAFFEHITSELFNIFTSKYMPSMAQAVTHIPMPLQW